MRPPPAAHPLAPPHAAYCCQISTYTTHDGTLSAPLWPIRRPRRRMHGPGAQSAGHAECPQPPALFDAIGTPMRPPPQPGAPPTAPQPSSRASTLFYTKHGNQGTRPPMPAPRPATSPLCLTHLPPAAPLLGARARHGGGLGPTEGGAVATLTPIPNPGLNPGFDQN
ncbi:MAG: hypothetical protein J3K34DRAFT_422700 [Monoraphidium minutum]|nr:MAG: hypothetical protein J3K34DRAFT_422700 [Monoraphidium minutum]